MTNSDRSQFEQLLIEALREEAEITMTMTNTPQQFDRFENETAARRKRARVIAVAAAAAAVVAGGIYAATTVGGAAAHRGDDKIAHVGPKPGPATVAIVTLPTQPTRVAAAALHTLRGPDSLGVTAFGSLWAMNGRSPSKLFRISPDGSKILSTLTFEVPQGSSDGPLSPFRAGSRLLLPASVGGHDAFLVLDGTGRKLATVPVAVAGSGFGDATGAWAITDADTVTRFGSDGRAATRTVKFPGAELAGVSEGAGSLWVLDTKNSVLLRANPDTGTVTGRTTFAHDTVLGFVFTHGAAYVSTQSYDLQRVDATSMKVTAVANEADQFNWAWQIPTVASNGDLWTNVGPTTIARLDPTSLKPLSMLTVDPSLLGPSVGGTAGVVVNGNRAFVTDVNRSKLYSFVLK